MMVVPFSDWYEDEYDIKLEIPLTSVGGNLQIRAYVEGTGSCF